MCIKKAYVSQCLCQCTFKKNNFLVQQSPLCIVLSCSCLTPRHTLAQTSSLCENTTHQPPYICVCLFGCVYVCTVLFVCQPIWQYLLSLLHALVLPCCLRSAAALWCPLTITPGKKEDYKNGGSLWNIIYDFFLIKWKGERVKDSRKNKLKCTLIYELV